MSGWRKEQLLKLSRFSLKRVFAEEDAKKKFINFSQMDRWVCFISSHFLTLSLSLSLYPSLPNSLLLPLYLSTYHSLSSRTHISLSLSLSPSLTHTFPRDDLKRISTSLSSVTCRSNFQQKQKKEQKARKKWMLSPSLSSYANLLFLTKFVGFILPTLPISLYL